MKIVATFGFAYKVSDRKYKLLMQAIAEDKQIDLSNYGTPLGHIVNITDMPPELAKEELEDLARN
jgi:hypothetical protein